MRLINYRELVIEFPGVCNFKEIKEHNNFSCCFDYQNEPWRFKCNYEEGYEKWKTIHELYAIVYKELTTTPKERGIRKAYWKAWINNIINNKADSNGEFIPSNQDIVKQL